MMMDPIFRDGLKLMQCTIFETFGVVEQSLQEGGKGNREYQPQISKPHIDFTERLTVKAFIDFPRHNLDPEWMMSSKQETHAKKILELSPNLTRIRYLVSPKCLKDQDFWQTYFEIVRREALMLVDKENGFMVVDAGASTVDAGSDFMYVEWEGGKQERKCREAEEDDFEDDDYVDLSHSDFE